MKREKLFDRVDWICGALAAVISFAVYAWTAAPNVTLLDSGEFITAAQNFGVPHPSGYPLWTLLGWLFTFLPLGNAAWEINLFSGFCAATAIGLGTALGRSTLRWLFDASPALRGLPAISTISATLLWAFSASMWSQAVIAEVYALHALLVVLFMFCLYGWIRKPSSTLLLLGCFFTLSLGFSNHVLFVVPAILPFLAVLLVKRRLFPDLLVASVITVLLFYLGLAIFSEDTAVLKTAIRLFYCVAAFFIIYLVARRFLIRWKLIAFLPLAVGLGLLPFAYMPLASSTNPPMNWGYARDPDGFFFSVNRSQYAGSLTELSVMTAGKLMGTDLINAPSTQADWRTGDKRPLLSIAQNWCAFFWLRCVENFTPWSVLAYFAAFFAALRLGSVDRRTWIYILHVAFILAAFAEPVLLERAEIDQGGWWLRMPFHTYTNFFYAILVAIGTYVVLNRAYQKFPRFRPSMFALLLLPLVPLFQNYETMGQRNRWFGWEFGHEMLKDLPAGSILFGGTDPGRFVPTYMIFGESSQPAKYKRDPNFDRRDLYIITQNGLGEKYYTKYIRDHYAEDRPQPKNAFERWLGRETSYPKDFLALPTVKESGEIMREFAEKNQGATPGELQSEIAKWIWERNRDKHAFFVEESFSMEWSYDYAVPHGLIYQILPEKLEQLPPEAVARDFAYWKEYSARLLSDPKFRSDLDARRSFSKLRQSIGNIYRHRKMKKEAEAAYREALELWPANMETVDILRNMLQDEGRFADIHEILETAFQEDPNNMDIARRHLEVMRREKADTEIRSLKSRIETNPTDAEAIQKLVGLDLQIGDTNSAGAAIANGLTYLPDNQDILSLSVNYHEGVGERKKTLSPARRLTELEPENADYQYVLALAYLANDKKPEFYAAARKALEHGGMRVREAFETSDDFKAVREEEEFKKLFGSGLPGSK